MLSGCVMKIGYFHLLCLSETMCMASEEGVLRASVCSVQARQGRASQLCLSCVKTEWVIEDAEVKRSQMSWVRLLALPSLGKSPNLFISQCLHL